MKAFCAMYKTPTLTVRFLSAFAFTARTGMFFIKGEMARLSLAGTKMNVPAIVMIEGSGNNKSWRPLGTAEWRLLMDIPGECVYEYSGDDQKGLIPDLAAYVEYALQHHIAHPVITRNDRRINPLQRTPG